MKTRDELQKEVNYLKSVIVAKDEDNLQMDAERHYLKDQVELMRRNCTMQITYNDRLTGSNERLEREIKTIKSKSLFQLIKWWWNAKN